VLQRTFHRWFLLSCTSFGWSVSEEKIKMWKVSRWQTTEGGCHVMVKASIAFRKLCFNIISYYVSPADSMFFTSMSSNSYILLILPSTHWWLNCSTFALQSSEIWPKVALFKALPMSIRVMTKLPNSEQSYKGKVKTHNYINRQNQSTTGKLWKP
jgi:hypothetical protein